MEQLKEIKKINLEKDFIKLSDLSGKDVKDWVRVPVRLRRTVNRNGLNASMNVVINPINLIIPIVSAETVNGVTRNLRYYKPERLISLLFELNLNQKDERGLDVNEWIFNAPIRFVKGIRKNGDEYHQLEILFKQYKYESVFLNKDQLDILTSLEKVGELKDFKGNQYKIKWNTRPEIIEDIGEDIFDF